MDNGMRHELKFLISRSAAELLRLRLPHVMKRDSHTGGPGSTPSEASTLTTSATAPTTKRSPAYPTA